MKKVFIVVSCLFLMMSLLSANAWAQPGRGRGMGGMMSRAMLLMNEDVQKELELSDRQLDELQSVLEAVRPGGPGGQGGQRGERGARGERGERGQGGGGQALREAEEKALKILDEDQRERLLGIYLWVARANAFTDEEVAKRVGIADDVKEKIAEIIQSSREEMRGMMQDLRDSGADMEEIQSEMRKFQEDLEKDVLDLLSRDQRAKVDQLKGKKFELQLFGRGRGGSN